MDPFAVEVGNNEKAAVVSAVGDALDDSREKAGPCCSAPGTRPARCAGAPHPGRKGPAVASVAQAGSATGRLLPRGGLP